MEDLPGVSATVTWLLTQGVLGFTTVVGFTVAALMYRAREKDRMGLQGALDARDAAHDAEVKSWIKLYTEMQAERLSDQKLNNDKLAAANELIKDMWSNARGGSQNARAS